jgi:Fe-Mn family superoxide dismutase
MKRSLQKVKSLLLAVPFLILVAAFYQILTWQTVSASTSFELAQASLRIPVASTTAELSAAPAKLPPLPYEYGALEPYIDAETMKFHHDNHHGTYVKNLNGALQKHSKLKNKSVEALLQDLNSMPEDIRTTVQNNGGGHLNHTIFWQIMAPRAGGKPTGTLAEAIDRTFGSFDKFKQQFNQAGGDRFGSGWVWLVRNPEGKLQITTTQNQDNPIMNGAYPILGNDVWEHAYYLKYQNRRPEYVSNWWNVVNWSEAEQRFARANKQ